MEQQPADVDGEWWCAAPPGVVSTVGYRMPARPGGTHRGLPSTTLVLIVSRDEGVVADGLPPNPLLLGPLQTSASRVACERSQSGVQLAVHPLAAVALLGVPATELDGSGFSGAGVLGRRGQDLVERLRDTRTPAQAARLVVRDFADGWQEARMSRPQLWRAWRALTAGATVETAAEQAALSRRRLEQVFRAEVGASPSEVRSLARFERAVQLLRSTQGRVALADVAARTGFADQAHLTRTFRRYAGCTPSAWLVEEFASVQDGQDPSGAAWGHEHVDLAAHPVPRAALP